MAKKTLSMRTDGNVCTLAVLSGFGESYPMGNGRNSEYHNLPSAGDTLEDFAGNIANAAKNCQSGYGTPFINHGQVFAFVVSTQKTAVKFLRELGWTEHESPEIGKYNHGTHMFVINPVELAKKLNAVCKGVVGYEALPEKFR